MGVLYATAAGFQLGGPFHSIASESEGGEEGVERGVGVRGLAQQL